ncbi:MAG: hypothetical protein M0P69_16920 [Bacteroidales bacterium]|nr:hypothetical protein [Bacteroidales bacterium]
MSSSFSLAKRQQCFALDLLQSVLWQYPFMVQGPVPKKSKNAIRRIEDRRLLLMDMAVHVPFVGEMSIQRQKQYESIRLRSKKVLDKHFAGEGVDGTALINAVLAMIEDVYFDIPQEKKRMKREWDFMRGSVATLYRHSDPEMDSPWQELGAEVARDMRLAVADALPWGYGKEPLGVVRYPRIVGAA